MNFVRSHRIRNGIQLFLIVGVLSTFFFFRESFAEAFKLMTKETPFTLNIMFLVAVAIAVVTCIFMFTKDLVKPKQKVIDEQKLILKNRISFYEKEISILKNQIEKLDSNG